MKEAEISDVDEAGIRHMKKSEVSEMDDVEEAGISDVEELEVNEIDDPEISEVEKDLARMRTGIGLEIQSANDELSEKTIS